MNSAWTWFLLGLKRVTKKPGVLAAAVLPVVFALCFSAAEKGGGQITIGYFIEKEDALTEGMEERLLQRDGLFSFRPYESEEALKAAVQRQEAECGYRLPEGLLKKLERDEYWQEVVVLESPATILGKAADEVFFSALFQAYSKIQAMAYVERQGDVPEGAAERIETLIEKNLSNGSVFSFRYETVETDSGAVEMEKEESLFPLRGIVAILVFAAAIFGAVQYLDDKERGIFWRLTPGFRYYAAFLASLLPAAVFGGAGILSFALSGMLTEIWLELAGMGLYCFAAAAFATVLLGLVSNRQAICGILPLITLASVLFTPVFFSVERILPNLKPICQIFLPRQYLRLFMGGSLTPLLIWTVGAAFIGRIIFQQKQKGNQL